MGVDGSWGYVVGHVGHYRFWNRSFTRGWLEVTC
jgi:hypothetical protein